jgi:hypothetical protein
MIAGLLTALLVLLITAGVAWLLKQLEAPAGAIKATWIIGGIIIVLILIALLCEMTGVWVDGPFHIHDVSVRYVR